MSCSHSSSTQEAVGGVLMSEEKKVESCEVDVPERLRHSIGVEVELKLVCDDKSSDEDEDVNLGSKELGRGGTGGGGCFDLWLGDWNFVEGGVCGTELEKELLPRVCGGYFKFLRLLNAMQTLEELDGATTT